MNRDELCVVLLKVLGFYLAVHALFALIPLFGTHVSLSFFGNRSMRSPLGPQLGIQLFPVLLSAAVQVVAGYFIMAKSSAISRWLLALGGSRE